LAKTYLSQREARRLKHLAVDAGASVAELLRGSLFAQFPQIRDV